MYKLTVEELHKSYGSHEVLKGNAPADDLLMADRFGLAVANA